jgi:hypothetical protein
MANQSVSKLDAAERQLHMAILLYFQDADALGVHTLAGAAHGILEDLARKQDLQSKGTGVQSGQRDYVTSMINNAKNFLKHADRDPDDVLTFNPDWTDFLMFEAIHMHIGLAAKLKLANVIFLVWLSSKYPSVLLLDNTPLGASAAQFKRIFPKLGGSIGEKKRTFFAALISHGLNLRGPTFSGAAGST